MLPNIILILLSTSFDFTFLLLPTSPLVRFNSTHHVFQFLTVTLNFSLFKNKYIDHLKMREAITIESGVFTNKMYDEKTIN